MKILHTSDWHLGNRMMACSRKEEFEHFLRWLLECIEQERPDALLVCGDVFDTTTPAESTRELYCDFLSRADACGCRRVIITAGNHDGVAQLGVSKPLLKRHHCTVVTKLSAAEAEECLVPICSETGEALGLVCAVPYLRPCEVSLPQVEEERQFSYVRGVEAVYARVAELAAAWKAAHPGLPVVAMGHLPVQGVETTAATRALIGTLDAVGEDIFAEVFDYVALGHIHKPTPDASARVQYCGSPLPIGKDETTYPHRVLVAELGGGVRRVRALEVPLWVTYRAAVCADRPALEALVEEVKQSGKSRVCLEVEYGGADLSTPELNTYLRAALPPEQVPLIRAARLRETLRLSRAPGGAAERLADYTPELIFRRRLAEYLERCPEQAPRRELLAGLFGDVLREIQNQ